MCSGVSLILVMFIEIWAMPYFPDKPADGFTLAGPGCAGFLLIPEGWRHSLYLLPV